MKPRGSVSGSIPASSTTCRWPAEAGVERRVGRRKAEKHAVQRAPAASDGAAQVSTGRRVKVDSPRGDRRNRRNPVDANDDYFEQALAA